MSYNIRTSMSVNTDYILKWPLKLAALQIFRINELITFGGKTLQLRTALVAKELCLSATKKAKSFLLLLYKLSLL